LSEGAPLSEGHPTSSSDLDSSERPEPGIGERTLGSSEEHYRRLIENITDIIQVLGPDGRILYTSPSAERMLGYHPDELEGQPGQEFVHPEDRPEIGAEMARAIQDPTYQRQLTFRLRHRNGSWRTCDVIARTAEDDDGRPILIVSSRDVTEQREAERALAQREARLRQLLSGVRAIVWECDAHSWEYHYISQGVEEILGYPPEAWYADPDLWADTIHPDDRTRVVEACRAGVQEARDQDLEYRAVARDGSVVWLRDLIRVVPDEEGEAARLQGVMIDITEEKTLANQLRQAQKMEAIGRLAGGIAHDFNNVLTAIQGHTRLLLEELGEEGSEVLRSDVQNIQQSAEHAAALTRQLLAFSRQQVTRPEVLDLNAHVRALEGMLGRLIEENVELRNDLDDDLVPVRADPAQVEQVIVNLVVNARDAMPDGGHIEVATETVVISEEDATAFPFPMRPGSYVRLSVADTGTGIPPALQERIFEPFFTTKEMGKGTGLGLSTVYGIVKQSGGFIHARSPAREGIGTRFEVYLPPAAEGARGTPEVSASGESWTVEPPSGEGRTILVVEDDERVRELLCEVLRRQGYELVEAENGAEAVEVAEGHEGRIDLLLTDVVMPEMHGREVAERIGSRRPDVPVLFVSGFPEDDSLRRSVGNGDVLFLEKPFSPETLLERIGAALGPRED